MSLDLRPLFTLPFWFDLGPQPPSDTASMAIFIVFGVVLVAGIVARLLRRYAAQKLTRVLIRRASGIAIGAAITGLVWFFCHYERVRFLGARFWFLLWIGFTLFALDRFVTFLRRDVPAMRARQEERAAK